MDVLPIPLGAIPPTQTPPTCGRSVLVKYELPHGTGIAELPGTVIRALGSSGAPVAHPRLNVAVFSDGPMYCPVPLKGAPYVMFALALFDPLDGRVPDVSPQNAAVLENPFCGRRVWCEWMPYQKAKHTERGNTPGPTA